MVCVTIVVILFCGAGSICLLRSWIFVVDDDVQMKHLKKNLKNKKNSRLPGLQPQAHLVGLVSVQAESQTRTKNNPVRVWVSAWTQLCGTGTGIVKHFVSNSQNVKLSDTFWHRVQSFTPVLQAMPHPRIQAQSSQQLCENSASYVFSTLYQLYMKVWDKVIG